MVSDQRLESEFKTRKNTAPRLVRTPYDRPTKYKAPSTSDESSQPGQLSTLRSLGSFSKSVMRAFGGLWTDPADKESAVIVPAVQSEPVAAPKSVPDEVPAEQAPQPQAAAPEPTQNDNISMDMTVNQSNKSNDASQFFDISRLEDEPGVAINHNLLISMYRKALLDKEKEIVSKSKRSTDQLDSRPSFERPHKLARVSSVLTESDAGSEVHSIARRFRRETRRRARRANDDAASLAMTLSSVAATEIPESKVAIQLVVKPITAITEKDKKSSGVISANFEFDDEAEEQAPKPVKPVVAQEAPVRRPTQVTKIVLETLEGDSNDAPKFTAAAPPQKPFSFEQPSKPVATQEAPLTNTTKKVEDDSNSTSKLTSSASKPMFSFGQAAQPVKPVVAQETPLKSPTRKVTLETLDDDSNGTSTFNTSSKPFSFESKASDSGKPAFSFSAAKAETKSSDKASEKSATEAPKPAFLFGGDSAASKPAFSFNSAAESSGSASSKPEASTTDKPAFSFGGNTSAPSESSKPSEPQAAKPFSFGASKTDTPAFSFGKGADDKSSDSADRPAKETAASADSGESDKPKFSFGDSAPKLSDAPSFSFGSTKPASESSTKPAEKPAFSFGASSDKPAGTPAFSFGAAETKKPDTPAAPADKPSFSFGASDKPADKPGFSFGASDKPADKPGFSFGASSNDKPADKPAFSFGASSSDKPASDSANKPSTGFSFGADKPAEKRGFSFESDKPAEKKTGFSFGADKPAEQTSGFTFGASSNAGSKETTPGFSFGANSAAPAAGTTGTTGGSAFTFNTQDANRGSTPVPSFGANSASTPAQAPAPGGFSFGANSGAAPSGGFGFGANGAANGSAPGATNGFAAAAPAAGSGFSFGANAAPAASSPFGFGASNGASGSAFGQPAAVPNAFGQPNNGGFAFGASSGSAPAPAPAFGGFGNNQQQPQQPQPGFNSPAPDASNPFAAGLAQAGPSTGAPGGRRIAQARRRLPPRR